MNDSMQMTICSLVSQNREVAALLGSFDPQKLVGDQHVPDITLSTLIALAKDCDEIESEQGFRWRLKSDMRRSTLDELSRSGRIEHVALKAEALCEDLFGHSLINAALRRPVNLAKLNTEALAQLHIAIQFLEPVTNTCISVQAVERTLARRTIESTLEVVLPARLFGRAVELKRLSKFVSVVPESVLKGDLQPEPMLITGIGGSGKSAMLAAFARKLMGRNWDGVPVIWLDFDRAAFASLDDPTVMLLEFSRQLALYRPELTNRLSHFRELARASVTVVAETFRSSDIECALSFDAEASLTSSIWSLWQEQLAEVLPLRTPLVLIFDTFEEVLVRGASETDHVLNWLQSLYTEGMIHGLRPILSGRILQYRDIDRVHISQNHIVMNDLPAAYAVRLLESSLEQQGVAVDHSHCLRLVSKFGGNPLLIRILSRYLAQEGGLAAVQDILVSGDRQQLDQRFAHGFIYTRILKRLRADEPDVEKLAHPGLVLRRVTPELIEHVLAQPCQLSNMNSERANSLFGKLSKYVWLVEHTNNPHVVNHRRDLRRLMLHLMTGEEREASLAIHARAAAYYQAHRDPYLHANEQDLEAQYHFLFIPQTQFNESISPRQLLATVGEDLEELPVEQRAKLKLLSHRQLNDDEAAALSEQERINYSSLQWAKQMRRGKQILLSVDNIGLGTTLYSQVGPSSLVSALYEDDDADTGLRMVAVEDNVMPSATPYSQVGLPSFVSAHYERANIEELRKVAVDVIEDFFAELELGLNTRTYAKDFTETPIWRVALASQMEVNSKHQFARNLQERLEKNRYIEWARPVNPFAKDGLVTAEAISMLLALCGVEAPLLSQWTQKHYHGRIETPERLRATVLLEFFNETSNASALIVSTSLLCDLSSTVLASVEQPEKSFMVHDQVIQNIIDLHNRGLTPTLAKFQNRTSRAGYIQFDQHSYLSQPARNVMRGLSPDLYPLIRGALSPYHQSLVEFAVSIQPQVWFWPEELTPSKLQSAMKRDPQRWTTTLIHFADRCGLLMRLVRYLGKLYPSDHTVLQMIDLCLAYDNRLSNDLGGLTP